MAVDKNLFMYDFAIVAIMKNEAPYVKEWLDYHLLAGVEHFFIYDHESTDNLKEILEPYIDAGVVTYSFCPGIGKQIQAYSEAFKTYRFFCRYMTFIDVDEFILPKSNKNIVEVVDEFFEDKANIGGIEVNWMPYGSNNQETADYTRGVLERFTRRDIVISDGVKTIANPRKINYMISPHYMFYFDGLEKMVDSLSKFEHKISDKILINHYQFKSREEYEKKSARGTVLYNKPDFYDDKKFSHDQYNLIEDDRILKYREVRALCKVGNAIGKPLDYEKLISALFQNIAPVFGGEVPLNFFAGKMETFLTCRALASYLKQHVLDKERGELIEKATLKAIISAALADLQIYDAELFISELPDLLKLNYPDTHDILNVSLEVIDNLKEVLTSQIDLFKKLGIWRDWNDYDNIFRILQTFQYYDHKQE